MAVFRLEELGGDLASAIPELGVGPWTCAPPGLVAFDAGIEQAGSLWRVELGRDAAVNQAALAGGERSVASAHAVLDELPRRFDQALDQALAEIAPGARSDARSGARPGARPESARGNRGRGAAPDRAESRLVAALIGAEPVAPLPSEWMAWSAPSAASPEAEAGRLARTLARIADLARGRARIATQLEGALVAHSAISLSGDTELWITPRLSLQGARLHARSVAVAARTRHAWARILTLVVRCCARIAVLGLPAAGLGALPTVWRFVRDLLREVRALTAAPVPA